MYTLLAVLIYTAAIAIPAYLLYHFRPQASYWHLLAVIASLVLGLTPIPPDLQTRGFDLFFGFVFVGLISWGLGGLIVFLPHREKHA
ncbi:conserved membrane hypothetical protein [Candidatus Sulfopaludibacter sp. SbA6]|nr:conserved membrane hypothetical protein [Candidatus Sulfopaludibacter sp. SbA6]